MARVVHSQHLVTILGSGEVSAEDIDEVLTLAPVLVAADGGADRALEAGIRPNAVIGDFDSVSPKALESVPKTAQHRIAEQTSTDFEKCLTRISAPLVLAIGVTGRRIDHELATYSVLTRVTAPPCIVVGKEDIAFVAPRRLEIGLEPGTRVSLFPFQAITGRSTGLHWPIDRLELSPMGRVGTSNRATGTVLLEFDQHGMLVILPRDTIKLAIAALQEEAHTP